MNVVGSQGKTPQYDDSDSEEEAKYLNDQVMGF